jgi:RND family efflux transporter MFP subunit
MIPLPSQKIRRLLATLAALISLTLRLATSAAENTTWVSGITEAVDDATLSSSVIGIIRSRPFQEGARVHKGDVILALDNRLEELEVVRKRLIRDHAKSELDRAKALADKSDVSITKEELDKKRAEYEVASADYDFAQEQLDRRKILAPFDGIISEYHLKPGEGCQALQPLVRIVDPRRCHLVVYVDAQIGIHLKQGDDAQLEIESGRTMAPFRGQIDFVSPVADPASGLMKAKIVFENDGKIRPGVAGRMLLPKEPNAN